MDEGQDRIQASYRDNYQRLTEIKKEYDPGSLFRATRTSGRQTEPLEV